MTKLAAVLLAFAMVFTLTYVKSADADVKLKQIDPSGIMGEISPLMFRG